MVILVVLFLLHYIFDYLLQPRSIANTKYCKFDSLFGHTLIYLVGLTVFGLYLLHMNIGAELMVIFVWSNFALHGITDFFTSKLSHRMYEKGNQYGFFAVLGLDQFIHIATLLLTMQYLLNVTVR